MRPEMHKKLLTKNYTGMTSKSKTITVEGAEIRVLELQKDDFLSMTDIAAHFGEARVVVQNWMRARGTLDFLGVWEQMHNPAFNRIEFDAFKLESGSNAFTMSPTKWIAGTGAVGMVSKAGRYGGGTFAHRDIALEFCSWLSPVFKLYIVKEFQRLKEAEAEQLSLDWDVKRIMTKANYRIHTEAVRQHLIPPRLQYTRSEGLYFASEADLLNLALFGMTARQWREQNPDLRGNMRDYASPEQLLVLSNLQSLNARLMKWDCDAELRLKILNEAAIDEMEVLLAGSSLQQLPADTPKPLGKGRKKK
jgi:hypothetical protein